MWAVQLRDTGVVAGSVLLLPMPEPTDGAPSMGEVEIGWHLHPDSWGNGYATEAAKAVLEYGFELGLPEILAIAKPDNAPSIAVMRHIGMRRSGEPVVGTAWRRSCIEQGEARRRMLCRVLSFLAPLRNGVSVPASSTRVKRAPVREARLELEDFDDDVAPAKRKKRKDPLWARLTVVAGALLMMLGGGGIVAARLAIATAADKPTTATMIDVNSGALMPGNNIDGAINLLLVGIDSEVITDGGHREGVLADSILIMHIPKSHDRVT